MAFATTKHLKLRAMRDSDKEHLIAQSNDPRVMRLAFPGYVVPVSPAQWEKNTKDWISSALMFIIIEVKREYAHLRKWDEGEKRVKDEDKKDVDWDRELFAGHAALNNGTGKNRNGMYGLGLTAHWFGNGFGTEVTEWVVQHSFEQLALHRITLGTSVLNAPAKRVYEKCGFVVEGITRQGCWIDGAWQDEYQMGILESEYFERKKQKLVGNA